MEESKSQKQVEKIIEILMTRDGMDYAEAYEYYSFNIVGSWMGENTPVFVDNTIIEG